MAIGSRVPIDRPEHIEALNNGRWTHIEDVLNGLANLFVGHGRVHGLDPHAHRIGMANDIGNLDLADIRQFRCDDANSAATTLLAI